MNIRQQDAGESHATGFALKLLSVSALALMLGISAAASQSGSDARKTEHEIEKQKDRDLLTPVRPLPRKVGESSWPEANPDAQRAANDRKASPPPRETTGQASNQQPPAQNNTPQPQQSAQPQQPAPQQPATAQNNPPPQNNAQPAQQQPATAQNDKPAQPPQAQPQQAQPPAQNAQGNQQQQQPATAQNNQQDQQSYASVRLGTDAGGKVAINDDQQRQLAKALRKQRGEPVELNVAVQVGSPPPRNVPLGAVTADMVNVLPQFRGYSYFASASDVYIVDTAANRVVAFFPVKATATASRPAPATRSTTGAATAEPDTASVPVESTKRTTRTTRRGGEDLAGIESAIEREMIRKGLMARGAGTATTRTVVVEDDAPVRVQRSPRWFPWFGGGRRVYEDD